MDSHLSLEDIFICQQANMAVNISYLITSCNHSEIVSECLFLALIGYVYRTLYRLF